MDKAALEAYLKEVEMQEDDYFSTEIEGLKQWNKVP